jgi:hypothetical protein
LKVSKQIEITISIEPVFIILLLLIILLFNNVIVRMHKNSEFVQFLSDGIAPKLLCARQRDTRPTRPFSILFVESHRADQLLTFSLQGF